MKRLGARGKSVQYTLSTLGGMDNKQGFEICLNVRGYGEQAIINLRSILNISHLPELKQSIPSPRDEVIHAEVRRESRSQMSKVKSNFSLVQMFQELTEI